MKTKNLFFAMALVTGLIVGAILHKELAPAPPTSPHGQLKLEEILSIKELRLVRHTYTDLFCIHRKNKSNKPVRAIAHVPVTVTAFLDLKNIKLEKDNGDTIRRVVLPHATLEGPSYKMNHMQVTRLRAFQLHAGTDLYADIAQYIQQVIDLRVDSVTNIAIGNHILEQAEAEGKEYLETLLKAVGRPDVIVTFGNAEKDKSIAAIQRTYIIEKRDLLHFMRSDTTSYQMDHLAWSNLKK